MYTLVYTNNNLAMYSGKLAKSAFFYAQEKAVIPKVIHSLYTLVYTNALKIDELKNFKFNDGVGLF